MGEADDLERAAEGREERRHETPRVVSWAVARWSQCEEKLLARQGGGEGRCGSQEVTAPPPVRGSGGER
jgi:hypothetical protein